MVFTLACVVFDMAAQPDTEVLESELAELKAEYQRLQRKAGRRSLARAAAIAGAGAISLSAVTAQSVEAQSGSIPASGSAALETTRADRLRLVPRSSAVSSPDDGVVTYRSDL